MSKRWVVGLFAVVCALFSGMTVAAELSVAEASEALKEKLTGHADIQVGDWVLGSNSGEVDPNELEELRGWAALGFVILEESGSSNIRVLPTDQLRLASEVVGHEYHLPVETVENIHILFNEEVTSGIITYRLVKATYRNVPTPYWQSLVEDYQHSSLTGQDRKLNALLEYDVFASRWQVVSYDWSTIDDELGLDNINRYLAAH